MSEGRTQTSHPGRRSLGPLVHAGVIAAGVIAALIAWRRPGGRRVL